MAGTGFGGVLMLLVVVIAQVVPFWRLLPRAGIPSLVALLAIFPLVSLVLLWIMAFKRWPGDGVRGGV
ncbi:MAG: hypothetical protein CVT86_02125 [Alphaproteobacteria bacterium HGW-Alphaproteobacteria-8]|nr:MAG: hypothetical protein CVT86_02125 [Alphaproteobacteria bacterium HGW-Alphaproteobacteria-8]